MRSRLRPDTATMVGLLTAAGVYLIYNDALPSVADVRAASPHDNDAEKARKHAAWASVALIGAVFLISRDFNSYIISGGALIAVDALHKHANAVNPETGQVAVDNGADVISITHPMPDYQTTG